MIIDFHTHIFPDKIAARVIDTLSAGGHVAYRTIPSAACLSGSMKTAGVTWSVDLPVITRPDQAAKVNRSLLNERESLLQNGILPFGGVHPDQPDLKEELHFLHQNGFKGIKLHPAFQGMELNDIRMLRLIEYASEEDLIIVTHAGWDVGFPQHNYAPVNEVLDVIQKVQPSKLVLAHMGGWHDWENVRKYLAGAPLWLDTSYCLTDVPPRPGDPEKPLYLHTLSFESFVSLCRAHGMEHILFGTDCPWSDQKQYVDLIRLLPLTEAEKEQILYQNACSLLEIQAHEPSEKLAHP